MKNLKNKKGFTLIEVMVVVAIIGALAAMGMQSTSKPVDESKVVKAQSEVAVLEIAINQYNIDHPTATISTISTATLTTLVSGGYLQRMPAYNDIDSCSYSYETVTKDGVTSPSKHVVLKSCTFNNGSSISVY